MAENTRVPLSGPDGTEAGRERGSTAFDITETIKRWYRESRDGTARWRQHAKEAFAFAAGEQWDPDDRAKLRNNGRPCITYNRIGPILDAVSGVEINNRQTIRYIPRSEEDTQVNELTTAASDFFRDEADANEEESDAFREMLICGLGWTETRMSYTEEPDGKMLDNRVDPFEMYWDSKARKMNLIDVRYVLRVRDFDEDDAAAMFPHIKDKDDLHADWAGDIEETKRNTVNRQARARYEEDTRGRKGSRNGKVRIVEAQWWEYETVYTIANPTTGELERLDKATLDKLKKKLPRAERETLPVTEQRLKVYKRAFVGTEILNPNGPDGKPDLTPPCDEDFTYQAITGKRDRNENEWYGIVRPMMDPQRWANGFMSAILHIIQTSGKGVGVEEGAVTDMREFEERYAQPDKIKWFANGALAGGKVFPIPGQQLPSGLPDMMVHAISAIRDVTGVNLELLGLADRQQAGVLEQQRKQAGLTILAGLYDSLRRYRKRKGRLVLWYIENRLSDGRLIRIAGPQGARYVPLLRRPGATRYDIIVDDTPTSPNSKEMVWSAIMQMGPLLFNAGLPPEVWATLVRYSPLPSSVAEPIAAALQKPKGENPMLKMEQEKQMAELQKKQMDIKIKELDLVTAQAEAKAKMEELQLKGAISVRQAQLDSENMQLKGAAEQAKAESSLLKTFAQQQADMATGAMTKANGDQSQIVHAFLEGLNMLGDKLAAAQLAPKKVVRDETGRISGAVAGPPNGTIQ